MIHPCGKIRESYTVRVVELRVGQFTQEAGEVVVYSRCCAAVGTVCSLAVTVEVKCMPLYFESIYVCNHFLDALDAWITKFHDVVTIQTD